ncbi:hypothetical protein C2R67_06415 [Helicobacter pylori]|nr:hypothetical protein C2R67_06415 [Helicobacter pylori]
MKNTNPTNQSFNDHKRLLSNPFIPNAKSGFRLVFEGFKAVFKPLKRVFSYNAFNSTLFRRSLKLLASFKTPFSKSFAPS